MNKHQVDYQGRVWMPISAEVAAGYERDPLGNLALMGLVIYGPTSDILRSLKLRELEQLDDPSGALPQDDPPTPQQLARAWSVRTGVTYAVAAGVTKALADMLWPFEQGLGRIEGEPPDEFYRRVATLHRAFSLVTKRPTTELARLAGVPVGTAAAWVSRARARGMFEDEAGSDEQAK